MKAFYSLLVGAACVLQCTNCLADTVNMVRQPLMLGDSISVVPVPVATTKQFPVNAIEAIAFPTRPPNNALGHLSNDCNLVSLTGIVLMASMEQDNNRCRIIIDIRAAVRRDFKLVPLKTVYELLLVCLRGELSPSLNYQFEIETLVDKNSAPDFDVFNGPLWKMSVEREPVRSEAGSPRGQSR